MSFRVADDSVVKHDLVVADDPVDSARKAVLVVADGAANSVVKDDLVVAEKTAPETRIAVQIIFHGRETIG